MTARAHIWFLSKLSVSRLKLSPSGHKVGRALQWEKESQCIPPPLQPAQPTALLTLVLPSKIPLALLSVRKTYLLLICKCNSLLLKMYNSQNILSNVGLVYYYYWKCIMTKIFTVFCFCLNFHFEQIEIFIANVSTHPVLNLNTKIHWLMFSHFHIIL